MSHYKQKLYAMPYVYMYAHLEYVSNIYCYDADNEFVNGGRSGAGSVEDGMLN